MSLPTYGDDGLPTVRTIDGQAYFVVGIEQGRETIREIENIAVYLKRIEADSLHILALESTITDLREQIDAYEKNAIKRDKEQQLLIAINDNNKGAIADLEKVIKKMRRRARWLKISVPIIGVLTFGLGFFVGQGI